MCETRIVFAFTEFSVHHPQLMLLTPPPTHSHTHTPVKPFTHHETLIELNCFCWSSNECNLLKSAPNCVPNASRYNVCMQCSAWVHPRWLFLYWNAIVQPPIYPHRLSQQFSYRRSHIATLSFRSQLVIFIVEWNGHYIHIFCRSFFTFSLPFALHSFRYLLQSNEWKWPRVRYSFKCQRVACLQFRNWICLSSIHNKVISLKWRMINNKANSMYKSLLWAHI